MDPFVDVLVKSIVNADVGEDKYGIYIDPTRCHIIAKSWLESYKGINYIKKIKKGDTREKQLVLDEIDEIYAHGKDTNIDALRYEICKYRGFPVSNVCCDDCFIIEPKTPTSTGLKELYEFSKLLEGENIIDKASLKFVHKDCGCT